MRRDEDWEQFKKRRQKEFEHALVIRMFDDTVYTTNQISYVYNLLSDFNLSAKTLRKLLFMATINKVIKHIQVERSHFWYIGKPMLEEFLTCSKCYDYIYQVDHDKECIKK